MRRVPLAPLIKFLTFTVVTALATTVLALTIANSSLGDTTHYRARFTDVAGLLPGSDVRIAGVKVGTVDEIAVVDRRVAEVRFSVQRDQPVPASVTAAVLYKNLIGQRYLSLAQGTGPPGAVLAPDDVIPIERTKPPLNLTVLFNGFRPLFAALDPEQINKLSFEIVQVLQGQGGTVHSLLASTASLTSEIADRDQVIGEVITNLNTVLGTVSARDAQLSELISSLQSLVSGLAADREPIGNALASIADLSTVTAGFVADARPALRDDIRYLGDLSATLADSQQVIDGVLQFAPTKLGRLARSASYGSWFQFYLCQASGVISVPPVVPPIEITPIVSNAPRCSA